jgi:DNA repair exonuclease SbcCD ATPase subunit
MTTTLTYSGTLTVNTCWCGMRHAIPSELYDFQQRQHRDGEKQTAIYCPLGHNYIISGKGEAEQLREQLATETRRRKAARELLAAEERSHAATRGHLTRTKKRVGGGVCPCCNRTFQQLARHMANKHPDYAANTDNT